MYGGFSRFLNCTNRTKSRKTCIQFYMTSFQDKPVQSCLTVCFFFFSVMWMFQAMCLFCLVPSGWLRNILLLSLKVICFCLMVRPLFFFFCLCLKGNETCHFLLHAPNKELHGRKLGHLYSLYVSSYNAIFGSGYIILIRSARNLTLCNVVKWSGTL